MKLLSLGYKVVYFAFAIVLSSQLWYAYSDTIVSLQADIVSLERQMDAMKEDGVVLSQYSIPYQALATDVSLLYHSLCDHRDMIIQHYQIDRPYWFEHPDMVVYDGSCIDNNVVVQQEAIRYYTLPGIGTMQVVHKDLASELWYDLSGFEDYIRSTYLDVASEDIAFEWYSSTIFVPLVHLTDLPEAETLRQYFDTVKIVAYVDVEEYPFLHGKMTIALFATKGDYYIKITSPYEQNALSTLDQALWIANELFKQSVQEHLGDGVLGYHHFFSAYMSYIQEHGIVDSMHQQSLVRLYLKALRDHNENPQWYIDFVANQLKRDSNLHTMLSAQLTKLSEFVL